jgi:putative FmdB family regulatory protein
MPIYEYKCESCGHDYEQIRRMDDADKDLSCPRCTSEGVTRQLSSFAAHGASGGSDGAAMPSACARPGCGSPYGGCGR